jgi:hypothetical protein
MAKRRKGRKGTSGLGRKRAKGRGSICVMVRRGTGKKGKSRASTQCFKSGAAANRYLQRAVSGEGTRVKSALVYRRKRKG